MPGQPPSTQVSAGNGAALAIVHADGTVDVYSVPQNASIAIQPQVGFGSVSETQAGANKSTAESSIDSILSQAGAQ